MPHPQSIRAALAGLLLASAGCGGQTPDTAHFASAAFGLALDYPAALTRHTDFRRGYLTSDTWKAYAGPDAAPGQPVVALALPDSNRITAGELRIGASRDPAAIRHCTDLPGPARPASRGERRVDGVRFVTFAAGDAAMNHFMATHSLRGVHAGACIAIDVLVTGTNPAVYDPPATPPFTREAAFARLDPLVDDLRLNAN